MAKRNVKKTWNVAIVGATGAVGEAMLQVLEQRGFPVGELHLLAGRRSAGRRLRFRDRELKVGLLEEFDFAGTELALFSAGAAVSAEHAPRAADAGCLVVDNTSRFRYDEDVPLVVPEVNAHALSGCRTRGIVANPNCSTIQMVVALKPIYDAAGIERINVCTYQAVSGSGRRALEELRSQSREVLADREPQCEVHPRPIAFNVLPHIDVFQDNGYTREEMKMVWETRKILGDDDIRINPTAVRVPVFYGHAEAVHLETREALTPEQARARLERAPGVVVCDERAPGGYPTPAVEAAGNDAVYVGRIRRDISHPRGLALWIVSDNVRKGAALNSVQLAELLAASA